MFVLQVGLKSHQWPLSESSPWLQKLGLLGYLVFSAFPSSSRKSLVSLLYSGAGLVLSRWQQHCTLRCWTISQVTSIWSSFCSCRLFPVCPCSLPVLLCYHNPWCFLAFDAPGHSVSHLYAAYPWVEHFGLSLVCKTPRMCVSYKCQLRRAYCTYLDMMMWHHRQPSSWFFILLVSIACTVLTERPTVPKTVGGSARTPIPLCPESSLLICPPPSYSIVLVIKADNSWNNVKAFQRRCSTDRFSASFCLPQGFCGFPFGSENSCKDKKVKVSVLALVASLSHWQHCGMALSLGKETIHSISPFFFDIHISLLADGLPADWLLPWTSAEGALRLAADRLVLEPAQGQFCPHPQTHCQTVNWQKCDLQILKKKSSFSPFENRL